MTKAKYIELIRRRLMGNLEEQRGEWLLDRREGDKDYFTSGIRKAEKAKTIKDFLHIMQEQSFCVCDAVLLLLQAAVEDEWSKEEQNDIVREIGIHPYNWDT